MNGILNDIAQQYQTATATWYSTLFPIANHLFATLAVIEIAWSGLWWALEKQDMESLWVEFLKRLIFLGFFYALLLHGPTWITGIITSFMQAGAQASHITQLDPSSLFDQGMSIASSVMAPMIKHHMIWMYLMGFLTALVITIAFVVIAGELVITLIESYLVIGAGILFLGLGSSRWTNGYTVGFLSYALNVGCKLFFLYLVIGVGSHIAEHWGALLATASLLNVKPILEVMGGSVIFMFIVLSIPGKAASLMSGVSSSRFSGVAATGAGMLWAIATPTMKAAKAGLNLYRKQKARRSSKSHHNERKDENE